uniref:argininosuccinate lyase n=1 Tax=Streptomyces lycopersici TaxID=2974589 RepID=UPI0021D0AF4A
PSCSVSPRTLTGNAIPPPHASRSRHIRPAQRATRQTFPVTALVAEHEAGLVSQTPADEDVHGYLERLLIERLGPLGGKLRAGRSRNDQTANELRIYLRVTAARLAALTAELVEVLIERAQQNGQVPAPGFTHLQPAQPITFGHQLLAHASALTRDVRRLHHAWESSSLSPLGAAALAGSPLSRDPAEAAREQGFDGLVVNSIDGVSSRDHVVDFLFAAAMTATDISRLSEELCLWSTNQFGWIGLDDAWSTGSSIMPQKKNPDIAELSRGKAARLNANLNGMLSVLKGLPFAYNRDLAEDKHFAFDSADTLALVLPAITGMVSTFTVNAETMAAQAVAGFTLATELADWLAEHGVPFSEAHDVAGRAVHFCESRGIALEDLTIESAREIDPRIGAEALGRLSIDSALARRSGPGGTAPSNIDTQSAQLRDDIRLSLRDFVSPAQSEVFA